MPAFKKDLYFEEGASFDEDDLYFIDQTGDFQSGLYTSAEMVLRDMQESDAKLTLTTANGGIVLNDIPNALYMRLTAQQIYDLQFPKNKGWYDIILYQANGESRRFAEGKVIVSPRGPNA